MDDNPDVLDTSTLSRVAHYGTVFPDQPVNVAYVLPFKEERASHYRLIVEENIAACLADISKWMSKHHLKLNLDKTELLFLSGKGCPHRDLAITVDTAVVTSTRTVRNLGMTLDDGLSLSANVASVTRSCRFLLYNIRWIRHFLTEKAAQVLIQALVISRLDYCDTLLAGAPASDIKPL